MTNNQYALVTGGSSGIGFAIAEKLAQKGYNLLLVSNQESELQKCSLIISSRYSVKCFYLSIDLSKPEAALKVYEYCHQHKLTIEILVNNAGILLYSEVASAPVEKVHLILQLHIHTTVMLCRYFGEDMQERRSGKILNVSSISAIMPYPGISLYGPTKTFIRYFTRALRSEMQAYKVTVTCVLPGATATALYDPNVVNVELGKKLGIMHTPEFVAQKAIRALFNNQAECIPGMLNKLTVFFLSFIPMTFITWLHNRVGMLNKPKNK